MKISKSSWIYDFQKNCQVGNGERYIPSNLCPYMRRFIRLCIGTAFAALIAVLVLAILLYPLFMYFVYNGLMLFITILAWLVILGAFVIHWYKQYGKHKEPLQKVLHAVEDGLSAVGHRITHNIFVQWIKAAHDVVCPTIEFEE
jgi:hypothetical protein